MKSLSFFLASLLPLTATPENLLIPDTWFQEITATDGSTQQCIIFTTVPGVEYTFYHSDELENWTEVGKTYGLGQQFSAAMRETAPAPPPPDPQNPPPPGPVLENASITIQASSDVAGGTVVSWVSLDHENAVQHLITGNMVAAWDTVPMFAETHGTHQFFIGHFITADTAPPAENSILGTKDAAMIADLEAAWSAFNTAVTTALEAARNTPPPPPDIDARGFWRIKADWSLDSDGDGSFDHAEFAMAVEGPDSSGLVGNAFNADSDGNGTPDGEQLDEDDDGTPDAMDIAPGDEAIAWAHVALPRYAVFPITGKVSPSQINDYGTVLFLDSTWKGGVVTPLPPAGNGLTGGFSVSINNNDEILGLASRTIQRSNEKPDFSWYSAAFWPSPSATPFPVYSGTETDTIYADGVWIDDEWGFNLPGPVLSDDRSFFAKSFSVDGQGRIDTDGENKAWTVAAGGESAGVADLSEEKQGMTNTAHSDLSWGPELDSGHPSKGRVFAPAALPLLPIVPLNVIPQDIKGQKSFLATFRQLEGPAQVYYGGAWKVTEQYADAIDIAANGVAIGKGAEENRAPIFLNGKWLPITRTAPGIAEAWAENADTKLVDTSPNGWVLAESTGGAASAMLPIRVKGRYTLSDQTVAARAVGVDDFSIGSSDPAASEDGIDHVQDRIWIMAPKGGDPKTVVLNTPVHQSAPVKITAGGILFGGQAEGVCNSAETILSVTAAAGSTSGDEKLATIKMGTVESISKPIGFKVMKHRTVKVVLWRVSSDRNPEGTLPSDSAYEEPKAPDFDPTKAELDNHLNDLFTPQINASFDCEIRDITVRFDIATGTAFLAPDAALNAPNGYLDTTNALGHEFAPIRSAGYEAGKSINIYLVGDCLWVISRTWRTETGSWLLNRLDGITRIDERIAVIANGLRNNPIDFLDTIAHEIGHILIGEGHPDNDDTEAVLLPGTADIERLMCSGEIRRKDGSSRLMVKQEWDRADLWLTEEENDGRIGP